MVNCVGGHADVEHCPKDNFCDVRLEKFNGAVCYPSSPENCTCRGLNDVRVDPYNNRLFFACSSEDLRPSTYECPHHMKFDPDTQRCQYNDGFRFSCQKDGFFADPSDCSRYYSCVSTTDGWFRLVQKCPCGRMYNEHNNMCENPCDWRFSCVREGRFRDPNNCNWYYECVANSTLPGAFRQTRSKCPDGSTWLPTPGNNRHGMCVRSEQNRECSPLHPTNCRVPEGWCRQGKCSFTLHLN